MKAPISVVINNYNYGRFLGEAIESAIAAVKRVQGEVIVVDDGSTDSSSDVLENFGTLVQVISQENRGQSAAIRAGVHAAQGFLVWLLDSDDRLHAEAGDYALENWTNGASFAQVHMDVIDEAGVPVRMRDSNRRLEAGDIWSLVRDRDNHSFVFSPTSGLVADRSKLLRALPTRDEEWRTSADAFLVHSLSSMGPVAVWPRVLASYRLHGSNVWGDVQYRLGGRDSDEWKQRIAVQECIRLACLAEFIFLGRGHPGDWVHAEQMLKRAISIFQDLTVQDLANARLSLEQLSTALDFAIEAWVGAATDGTRLLRSRTASARREQRIARLDAGVCVDRPALVRDFEQVVQSRRERSRNGLRVWKPLANFIVEETADWPRGARWTRGFANSPWEHTVGVISNAQDCVELRLAGSPTPRMLRVLWGSSDAVSELTRLELLAPQFQQIDFCGLVELRVPLLPGAVQPIRFKCSVLRSGQWRKADPGSFHLIALVATPTSGGPFVESPIGQDCVELDVLTGDVN